MSDNKSPIGNRIKDVARHKGVTPLELKEGQGVSLATVYNWFSNETQPKLLKMYAIAEQLQCCVHHLIHPSPVPKELQRPKSEHLVSMHRHEELRKPI